MIESCSLLAYKSRDDEHSKIDTNVCWVVIIRVAHCSFRVTFQTTQSHPAVKPDLFGYSGLMPAGDIKGKKIKFCFFREVVT